jgi:tRNA (mo5U34)-methyltransferase
MDYLEPFKNKCNLPALKELSAERERWKQRPSNQHYQDTLNSLAQLDPDNSDPHQIKELAKRLIPWRKGPFNFSGLEIDAEWRSDKKWQRIAPYLDSLSNKVVLDIGCNNGYFLFEMAKQNPKLLLGIDPMVHYWAQFQFAQHFYRTPNCHFELLGIEHLPHFQEMFDVIFSMGIIYHHRHPIEQLINIRQALRPGGQLILETIGIPGEESYALFPQERYAKMKNVWFVPTRSCFENWVKRAKFIDVEIIADTLLTPQEQRLTPWCPPPHQSLEDFLLPEDRTKTVENYPAPRRFALVARKKG